MKRRKLTIEWCGPCWIKGGRSLSEHRIGENDCLPVCDECFAELRFERIKVEELFKEWDAMPAFDERPNDHFGNLLRMACKPLKSTNV